MKKIKKISDYPKVLVEYIYSPDKLGLVKISTKWDVFEKYELRPLKGEKIGVVVAIDKDKIGYSLCNKKDKFDKDLGLHIALERAEIGYEIENSINSYGKMNLLTKVFEKMTNRAKLYFK